jgi:hypothetical protein
LIFYAFCEDEIVQFGNCGGRYNNKLLENRIAVIEGKEIIFGKSPDVLIEDKQGRKQGDT